MFLLGIRSLLAHKLRMLMSVAAVVLGVAFVAGTLVFTGSLSSALDDVIAGGATDVSVTPKSAVDGSAPARGGAVLTVPDTTRARIGSLPGVSRSDGSVTVPGVFVLGSDGKVVGKTTGTSTGIAWTGVGFTQKLDRGAAPVGDDQVVLDDATAALAKVSVGQPVRLLLADGQRSAVVSGIFTPAGASLGGQAYIAFPPAQAQRLLLEPGQWSAVDVTLARGASDVAVRDRIKSVVGATLVVRTRAEQIATAKDAVSGGLSFFTYFLLGFAVVALLVGGFLIANTFAMVVAQRSREMALLRAVGATRKQVTRALMLEALAVGAVGSLIGLALGLLVAVGLGAAFGALGLDLAISPTLPPTAVAISLVLGIGVTAASAYLPLRRAGKIAPVQALRESAAPPEGSKRRRLIVGLGVLVLSAGLFVLGAAQENSSPRASYTGLAALTLLVATVALAPALATALTRAVGRLVPRAGGAPAMLARANTVRNPRRTAATASALMIGLALVTGITIVASSASASVDRLVDGGVNADLILSSQTEGGFDQADARRAAAVDGVSGVVSEQNVSLLADGAQLGGFAVGGAPLATALTPEPVAGKVDDVPSGAALVDEPTATAKAWRVGQVLRLTFPTGATRAVTLQGIYKSNQLMGTGLQINRADYIAATNDSKLAVAFVTVKDGADVARVTSAVNAAVAGNPLLQVEDRTALKARSAGQLDKLLGLVYGLLALSIVIAVLGVVNTMGMSVLERTREIGLLRAVGLTRKQARRMIRGESVMIAALGGLLGVSSGVVIGVALQRALAEVGIAVLSVPVWQIALFLVGAGLVGILAALAPARRAARMDVLGAIGAT
jgi:putative ABC transport system permease protein